MEEKADILTERMNQLINHEGDCITAGPVKNIEPINNSFLGVLEGVFGFVKKGIFFYKHCFSTLIIFI